MEFGSKVKFKSDKVHQDLRDKIFCLIGFDATAFAIVEWDDRGKYHFNYYQGDATQELVVIEI